MKVTFYDYKKHGERLELREVEAIEDKGKGFVLVTISAAESERIGRPWILDINNDDFSTMEIFTI